MRKYVWIALMLSFSSYAQLPSSEVNSLSSYFFNKNELEKKASEKAEELGVAQGTTISKGKSSSLKDIMPLALNVSTKEKQLDVRNSYEARITSNNTYDFDLLFGLSIGGKIDNTISNVLSNRDISGGFKFGGILGVRWQQNNKVFSNDTEFKNAFIAWASAPEGSELEKQSRKELLERTEELLLDRQSWFYISPNFEGRKFVNVSELESTDFQKITNTLSEVRFGIAIYDNDFWESFQGLFDISLTLNRADNFKELKEISSSKQFSQTDTISNVKSTNTDKFTAFVGNYEKRVRSKTLQLETYIIPKNLPLFALNINPAFNFDNQLYQSTIDLNYTIYFLSKKDGALTPNFGLVFSHRDLLGKRDVLFKDDKSRFSIGIVTRLNVGRWFN